METWFSDEDTFENELWMRPTFFFHFKRLLLNKIKEACSRLVLCYLKLTVLKLQPLICFVNLDYM